MYQKRVKNKQIIALRIIHYLTFICVRKDPHACTLKQGCHFLVLAPTCEYVLICFSFTVIDYLECGVSVKIYFCNDSHFK